MFFDAHCHLDEFREPEREIAECRKAKVVSVVSNSVDSFTMTKNIALSKRFPEVECALGIHPSNLLRLGEKETKETIAFMEKNIESSIAVGETGLDYKHADTPAKKERQREIFGLQLGIAESSGKPVIVHSRFAAGECIAILEKHDCKILFHWFSGTLEELQWAIELGAFFSIGPSVESNTHIQGIAKAVPAGRFLSETDAPVPFLGKNAAPHRIPDVVEAIANARGEKKWKIALQIEKNFKRFF